MSVFCSISALVAHYYIVNGDDLECCLRRPAANHKPFTQLSQDEQVSQLRRMHTMTPATKALPIATNSWYQIGVEKSEVLEALRDKPDGTFVIRNSAQPKWFANAFSYLLVLEDDFFQSIFSFVLSYVFNGVIIHELIEQTEDTGLDSL